MTRTSRAPSLVKYKRTTVPPSAAFPQFSITSARMAWPFVIGFPHAPVTLAATAGSLGFI
jgi:hypothetical protein